MLGIAARRGAEILPSGRVAGALRWRCQEAIDTRRDSRVLGALGPPDAWLDVHDAEPPDRDELVARHPPLRRQQSVDVVGQRVFGHRAQRGFERWMHTEA